MFGLYVSHLEPFAKLDHLKTKISICYLHCKLSDQLSDSI